MRWSPARRCLLAFASVCLGSLALTHSASAQEKTLTLALARSAITPGEETFTYAVPKQLGWFKREGLTVNLLKANGSTAAICSMLASSARWVSIAARGRPDVPLV